MRTGFGRSCLGFTAIALTLGSCASKKIETAAPQAPATPRPQPPAGASANLVLPARDAAGHYITVNSGIDADEAVWHLRAALNVAALSCETTRGGPIVTSYNSLLKKQKKTFSAAYAAQQAGFKKRFGSGWQAEADEHSTRLYNFFAQPPAKRGFCTAAETTAREALLVEPSAFKSFAATALPRLEAPFIAFYDAYADYRVQLAAWENRRTTTPAQLAAGSAAKAAVKPAATTTRMASAAPAAQVASTAVHGVAADPSLWRIQLGAYADSDSAQAAWSAAREKLADLAALEPRFEPVPTKNMVRLQAGPVKDGNEATRLCNAATAAGQACFPVHPAS